jgi:hypothetical protein
LQHHETEEEQDGKEQQLLPQRNDFLECVHAVAGQAGSARETDDRGIGWASVSLPRVPGGSRLHLERPVHCYR